MISRCEDCKWNVAGAGTCLLGRKEETCDSPKARRGDDGLAVRLMDAYKEGRLQLEKMRKQNEASSENER
ncbi:MAG TPA: hypothetical protein ENN38_01340 [Actinobacteria bacterium]|nr:hypothetical protein [Actinomycetota bacterium]